MTTGRESEFNIALQFGRVKHWNEGLAEVARQLARHLVADAVTPGRHPGCRLHYILPAQWHGMFGPNVSYHEPTDAMRLGHRFPVDLDVWHGLHQHMRFRPPENCRHSLITVHDMNHVYAKRGFSLWWQNLRLTRQLRRADQLVAISRYVADDMRRHLPWAPAARVIYNGVADLSLESQRRPHAFVPDDFLLHISRMSKSKNVDSLLRMAAIWPEQSLVLVGPASPEVDTHRANIAQLGLNNVHILNDVKEAEKAWLLAHCKAFVFPSLLEGFGLPPIEAMGFGKPVVVARRSALPEVCGDAAAYWDDFDPQRMRAVVQASLAEQSLEAVERRRAWAQRYAWTRASQDYQALYFGDSCDAESA